MDVADRLNTVVEREGLTRNDLAGLCGVDPSTASRWLNGKTTPYKKNMRLIADAHGYSLSWLERGEGEMLLPGQGDGDSGVVPEAPAVRANPATGEARQFTDEELAERDLYRVRRIAVQAGYGAELVFLDDHGEEEVLTGSYIRRKYSIQPQRLAEVRVHGESMNAPPANVAPGAVLKVAMLDEGPRFLSGAVYVVRGPHGYQLKRLRIEEEETGDGHAIDRFVWLWSDNEDEGRQRLPIEVWERDYEVVALALTVENSL